MTTHLLVITSDVPFGEHIRQSLEETGKFTVFVTGKQETAAAYGRDFKPALAFLDTTLSEHELYKIGFGQRKSNPDIGFVIISETGATDLLEELSPLDNLSKPFYLPDLLEMMEKYFRPAPPKEKFYLKRKDYPESELPWLSDVTRAAQHLTRLTLESSAQAALITRDGELWAYAGQLPQMAARELADTVSRYWDRQQENNLVRFIRLSSTNAEHMLYATRLAEGMVLALVFDAETPFSTIRTQASQLVHSLSTSPSEEPAEEASAEAETDLTSLSDILSNVPTPNPLTDTPPDPAFDFKPGAPTYGKKSPPPAPITSENSTRFSRESSPAVQFGPLVGTDRELPGSEVYEETIPSRAAARKNTARKADPDPESSQETSPNSIDETTHRIVLEPASPAVYNLDYACMLVPRFAHHHLTGDLSERLGEWVQQFCIAFGWRLEHISIRPDYLQWIVSVPPATSPAYLMRVLRKHISENIFTEFPRFIKENPSGDFWAPGYLIMGGSQPPPAQLIKDFIAQTRQRQGYSQQNDH